ncbi:MAG: YbhB/YbcL family Raf kinase inhibitor-like protein [Candidatus Paceibacterota bacterium]
MNKTTVLISGLLFLLVLVFLIQKTMQEKNIAVNSDLKNLTKIEVRSFAFKNTETIPQKYTCDGDNIMPPIEISNVPKEAKSLAFIIEDPDASYGTWDHLVMWNLPAENFNIEEGKLPVGTTGIGSSGSINYEGPCPPKGKLHRYFFNLYALDTLIKIPIGSEKDKLIEAMEGHIIGKGEMYGTYSR